MSEAAFLGAICANPCSNAKFCYVVAWEYAGEGKTPVRNEEPLTFETVKLVERSYK